MPPTRISPLELEQYLAHELPADAAARVERWIHDDPLHASFADMLRKRAFDGVQSQIDVDTEWAMLSARMVVDEQRSHERPISGATSVRAPRIYNERISNRGAAPVPRMIRGWALVAGAAATLGVLWVGTPQRTASREPGVSRVYTTNATEESIVTLRDGSRVTLGPGTTLRLANFGNAAREVMLERGDAYFQITPLSNSPFLVRTGTVTTRVLGTEFLVRYQGAHTRVAVADGKVLLTTSATNGNKNRNDGVTLTAGQIGEVTDSVVHVNTVDGVGQNTAREAGRLVFRNAPLPTVLETLRRWYGYEFRYVDQTLEQQRLTVVISTQSSAQALAAIERVLAVNLTVTGDTVTLGSQHVTPRHLTPRTYDVWTPTKEVGR